MNELLQHTLRHLADLVAIDTQNPPRDQTADGPLVQHLRRVLPGFEVSAEDYGDGCILIEAKRGRAPILFNVHLDTVPAAEGWSTPPHELQVSEDRAQGLGSCDIKGAAAILISLAELTDAPLHLVFNTDEEAGQSRCMRRYLERPPEVRLAVVGEPTLARAVFEHRGIFSARRTFSAPGGHASGTASPSAVHDAARWIAASLEAEGAAERKLNFGRIEGGLKPNMIAAQAELLFGFRQHVGETPSKLLERIEPNGSCRTELHPRFEGPSLPSSSGGRERQGQAAQMLRGTGIAFGEPVSFWTEASLFSEAGVPAVVLGPGSIEQAHQIDEWVSLTSLEETARAYERIIAHV